LLLKGLVYQGYQCTVCGHVIHRECLEKLKAYCGRPDPPPRREDSLNSHAGVLHPRPVNV
jgi:hypothetical protein